MKKFVLFFSMLFYLLQGCGPLEETCYQTEYKIDLERYTNYDNFIFHEEVNGMEIQVSNNINIEYPQISNMKDKEKEEMINDALKKAGLNNILKYVETQKYGKEPDLYNVKKCYIAYQTNEILSVYFLGKYQSHSGICSYPFFAITINLLTGKEMTLDDFVTVDDEFIEEVINSDSIMNSMIMELEESNKSIESLKSKILYDLNESKDAIRYNLLNNADSVLFYVTKTSVTIAIGVRSASGSYALIDIPR